MLCFCFNRGDQISDVGSVRRNSDESREQKTTLTTWAKQQWHKTIFWTYFSLYNWMYTQAHLSILQKFDLNDMFMYHLMLRLSVRDGLLQQMYMYGQVSSFPCRGRALVSFLSWLIGENILVWDSDVWPSGAGNWCPLETTMKTFQFQHNVFGSLCVVK